MIFLRPASRSVLSAATNWAAALSLKPVTRMYPIEPFGEVLLDDLALDDRVAHDRDVERGAGLALDRQDDLGPLLATNAVAGLVDRQPIEPVTVDGQHRVARHEDRPSGRASPRSVRRRSGCSRPEGRAVARLAGRVPRADLGADPLELAGQVLEAGLVFLRREIRGVRVVERLDHAPDRARGRGPARRRPRRRSGARSSRRHPRTAGTRRPGRPASPAGHGPLGRRGSRT